MTVTITYPGAVDTINPDQIDGYDSERESGNVLHPIAGRASGDATLAPAQLRTGTLRLVFADEAASKAAEDAHSLPVAFTFSASDLSTVDMYYILQPGGRVRRSIDEETRNAWLLEVPFQEVSP